MLETDVGDELFDLGRDELATLEPPITRESLLRFDPSWQEEAVDPGVDAVVRARLAAHGRS